MGRLTTIKPRIAQVQQRIAPATISATVRTRGSRWMKTRERILSRDCGLCVQCSKSGHVTPATEIDHIVGLQHGGTDADDNLQSLCHDCHAAKTAAEGGVGSLGV